MAFLGGIGTEKVLDYMKSLNLDESHVASIESTTLAILEGVSSNVNNIYYPMNTRILLEMHKVSPEIAQILFTYLYKIDGTFNT